MPNRTQLQDRELRHARTRKKIKGTNERPRLSLFISNKQIYTQVIDDALGKTLASASTVEPALKEIVKNKPKVEACKLVGARLAEVAKQAGITKIVFDRSGYKYGQRLRALADAAREGGLEF